MECAQALNEVIFVPGIYAPSLTDANRTLHPFRRSGISVGREYLQPANISASTQSQVICVLTVITNTNRSHFLRPHDQVDQAGGRGTRSRRNLLRNCSTSSRRGTPSIFKYAAAASVSFVSNSSQISG